MICVICNKIVSFHAPAWERIRISLTGRSRYLSSHSTRTASFLDCRGFHVCDYAAANRTYAGYYGPLLRGRRERAMPATPTRESHVL